MRQRVAVILGLVVIILIYISYPEVILKYGLPDETQFDHFSFRVYDLGYGVACCGVNNNKIVSRIDYCGDRTVKQTIKLDPVYNLNPQTLLNLDFDDVVATYGEPHVDLGSGFFMPCYLTADAYLIMMRISNENIVFYVSVMDLLSGTESAFFEA